MKHHELEVMSDGVRLACEVVIPPDPRAMVVLLHGIPSSAPPDPGDPGYAGFADHMARRGYGALWGDMRAARGAEGYFSIEGWVRDAAAFIETAHAVSPDDRLPVVVVGSSAGGAVGLVAVRRGARAAAVATLGSPASWTSFAEHPEAGVVRISRDAAMPLAPEVVEDPTAWAAEFVEVVAEDAIAHIEVPVLVVHGTADDVVPVSHAYRLEAYKADTRLVIIEGAGHHLRRDERAVAALENWLEEVIR